MLADPSDVAIQDADAMCMELALSSDLCSQALLNCQDEHDVLDVRDLKSAAEQGNASAQQSLAFLYTQGTIVKKNYQIAFDLYQKAASKSLSTAKVGLGILYMSSCA